MPAVKDTTFGNSSELHPHLSLIVPCYNEEEVIAYTLPQLHDAFAKAGYRLQLVAIDNGSFDDTGTIIKTLAEQYPLIMCHRVETNQGYGYGVLQAMPLCTAPWIGIIPADGQVDAEDVVRLFAAITATRGRVLGKVRRRFRLDGIPRKLFSASYNLFFRLLWPRIRSIDINGSPKILPRSAMRQMELESHGWILDPEIMVKAHYMGLSVLELNVFGRMRGAGMSHVRAITCLNFFARLVWAKISRRWFRQLKNTNFTAPDKLDPPIRPQPHVEVSNP